MILRIVRGEVPERELGQLVASFATRYAPTARRTPGLVRFHVATRRPPEGPDGVLELVSVTFWASAEVALEAYGGDLMAPRTLDGLAPAPALPEVGFFEVDETILRRSPEVPQVLRLTVGRIAAGLDAEIQAELRQRVHAIGDAMTEAYVGRRMLERDVEIAFVSAWRRDPEAAALETPLWPDISDRYDAFDLRLYRPLASGSPAPA